MSPHSLLAWWNLIFVVPFGLALVYLALYTLTGITFGEGDGDAAHDVDHDVDHHVNHDVVHDVDHDADADAEVDAGADTDLEIDSDADAGADMDSHGPGSDVPLHLAAMSFVGIGRVPLSVLLMVLLMSWGATGFVVNQIVLERFRAGASAAAVSIPVAALTALAFTRVVVRVIDRWLPLNETSARRRHELLGRAGEAIFPIGKQFGLAAVRDDRGELYQVPCQLDPRHEDPIAKGARVRLVAYSAKTKSFYVTTFDPGRGAAA